MVVKRSGEREPFDREKIVAGVQAAAKNRPVGADQLDRLASAVEDDLRLAGGDVTSAQVGMAVLEQLRATDQVAAVRFASVYKEFDDPADFARELGLLTKDSAPKRR